MAPVLCGCWDAGYLCTGIDKELVSSFVIPHSERFLAIFAAGVIDGCNRLGNILCMFEHFIRLLSNERRHRVKMMFLHICEPYFENVHGNSNGIQLQLKGLVVCEISLDGLCLQLLAFDEVYIS